MAVLTLLFLWGGVNPTTAVAQQTTKAVHGVVVDEQGKPIPGVTIIDPTNLHGGTTTNAQGAYSFVMGAKSDSLRFSFIGYETITRHVRNASLVKMQPTVAAIGEVVVTGIYTRKAESFTGASTTISKSELLRVGNQNILQSLKNLDPTIYIADNLAMGSDPNTIPSMSMRGTSSFPATTSASFKSNYQNQPNQPLFILDGFETSAETIMDMDMNRIESLTILKDAAAKALYGSKAANGVVVVETKRLSGNQQLFSYNGNVTIEVPDLSSYDLCNPFEKLQVELAEGLYSSPDPTGQIKLTQLYNTRRKLALEGLNTYWMAKPLRTGVGHKHNLSLEVGNAQSVRAILDVTYNDVSGVMKGSDRQSISGNANISYRTRKFLFRNIMSVLSNKSNDSPYGSFNDYAQMNPFWQATDASGKILRWAEGSETSKVMLVASPLYDATIGTLFTSSYLKFTNNFYAEWHVSKDLKATARIGVSQQRDDSDKFYPAAHSMFSGISYASQINRRGKYILENGKNSSVSGDLNVSYNKTFRDKHTIFANAGAFISESSYEAYQHTAEGFPNNQAADITFARQYAQGSTPVGFSSLNREISFLASFSYDYDNRYLIDATYRNGASSLYGANNRWASSWSVGAGWNIHNEAFMKNIDFIKQLKIRASIGVTGNQNFSTNQAIATYLYYTGINYQGQTGAYLANMPNPSLMWEQKKDYNIGVDTRIWGLTLSFDYYRADTKNMLTSIAIPTSTGFGSVKDNLGLVRNNGFEIKANYILGQGRHGFVSVNGTIAYNKNKIVRLSESMQRYNDLMKKSAANQGNSTPVLMYEDGLSMSTIWAVPSAGIDPATGQELYIKRDGSLTYTYDAADLIAAGVSDPTYRGTLGFSAEYKGFGLSATLSYMGGGQLYNYTLVDRVENIDPYYNVDRRVLLGRWQRPGQEAQFKKLGMYSEEGGASHEEKTRATTRFVQDHNELSISSLSCYYEFPRRLISRIKMQRLRLSFYANDVATFSTIKIERGVSYPFARTMSFSLTGTF